MHFVSNIIDHDDEASYSRRQQMRRSVYEKMINRGDQSYALRVYWSQLGDGPAYIFIFTFCFHLKQIKLRDRE